MIEAEMVGGPRDGEVWALPNCHTALKVPVPRTPDVHHYDDLIEARMEYRVVEMMPVLTKNGWRLYWKEPSC